jgi:hypothetical protein
VVAVTWLALFYSVSVTLATFFVFSRRSPPDAPAQSASRHSFPHVAFPMSSLPFPSSHAQLLFSSLLHARSISRPSLRTYNTHDIIIYINYLFMLL